MSVKPLSVNHNWLAFVTKAAFVALVWCGVLVSGVLATAQIANGPVLYRLSKESTFQWGCFAPCECPVMVSEPVRGTFLLSPNGFDGVFTNYAVTDVHWSFTNNNTATTVTGSGTYKVAGKPAPQQELSLFLQMDGGDVKHFDSGLVTNSVSFPDINVSVSTNGQYCFDAVFNVSASPTPSPQLQISVTGTNNILVSWQVSPDSFILQESSDLTKINWTTVTNAPTVIGQQNQVVLPRSAGIACYRLQPAGN
jgi:hypothetical protein